MSININSIQKYVILNIIMFGSINTKIIRHNRFWNLLINGNNKNTQ